MLQINHQDQDMSKKIVYFSFILLLICFKGNAQSKEDTLSITFKLKFNKEALAFNQQYITTKKKQLKFDNFKSYILLPLKKM